MHRDTKDVVYDSTVNASISTVAPNPKEFVKKKRVNRTAKLKQSKLVVHHEQWLSQVNYLVLYQ